MSSSSLEAYREAASSLTPSAVSQYLAAQSWELESRQDRVREVWRLSAASGRCRVMLPLATDYEDFNQRFRDALYAIGKINDWDADQLQERILAAHADLFFIRLDQPVLDGTISFLQAERTIESINKMIRAAATTTADPQHSHLGKRPAVVREFLEDDLRLGHTKRGSFVFTVATRMNAAESTSASEPTATPDEAIVPFSRRVMVTLARGLEATQKLAAGSDESGFMENPSYWGLSAGLVESLEEMTAVEGLRSVDLSFDWAAGQPRPAVGDRPIVLDHSAAPELARVRERLVRKEEPPRRETLVGLVRALTREDDDEAVEAGTVVIAADVRGRIRNVRMTLFGPAHEWAILAYSEKLPLTVTGDLVFERRAWYLKDPHVDSSFLEHRQREIQQPGERRSIDRP